MNETKNIKQTEGGFMDITTFDTLARAYELLIEGMYRTKCECDNTHDEHGTQCWHCDTFDFLQSKGLIKENPANQQRT